MKKSIKISIIVLIFTGCQSTSLNNGVANNSTHTSSSNCKIYPYKSAILKYKQKEKVLIWNDWGLKTYESRRKDTDIIMINNGLEYRIKHHQKKITKMRSLVMDWLIVADKDLRPYYVDSSAKDALVKTGERENVAGQSCNIWLDSIPHPDSRYCLYDDLILLKKEKYDSRNKKWSIVKEAYMAKFNTTVDGELFTNIPNYPIRNMSRNDNSYEVHKRLKEDSITYKQSLEVANKVKARGESHREGIRLQRTQGKRMMELYLNRRVGNGIYYP